MNDPYGMEDALLQVELENPLTYVFASVEYPCSRGDATTVEKLGYGGYAPEADAVVVVRKSALPETAPALKSEIVLSSRTYLIDQIVEDANAVFQVWSLSDPQKAT